MPLSLQIQLKEFQQALQMLSTDCTDEAVQKPANRAIVYHLKAQVYVHLKNIESARTFFEKCLFADVTQIDAFNCMAFHNMLSVEEGLLLIKGVC
jgi:hypothetical protein